MFLEINVLLPMPLCGLNFGIAGWLARCIHRFFFWCRPTLLHVPREALHLLFLNKGHNILFFASALSPNARMICQLRRMAYQQAGCK